MTALHSSLDSDSCINFNRNYRWCEAFLVFSGFLLSAVSFRHPSSPPPLFFLTHWWRNNITLPPDIFGIIIHYLDKQGDKIFYPSSSFSIPVWSLVDWISHTWQICPSINSTRKFIIFFTPTWCSFNIFFSDLVKQKFSCVC